MLSLVVHADWSAGLAKRRMACALREASGRWLAYPPEPVGYTGSLLERLLERAGGGTLLAGFDFPIGMPRRYARRAGLDSFAEALAAFGSGRWADFYRPAENPEQISLYRPFYPRRAVWREVGAAADAPPLVARQQHLLDGLGLESRLDLLRLCDLPRPGRRAASPLFWTLGAQQVGRAAAAGWQEVIWPWWRGGMSGSSGRAALWPFDGSLSDLLGEGQAVAAESYPGEFYDHLGIRFGASRGARGPKASYGKRSPSDRAANAPALLGWANQAGVELHPDLEDQLRLGFGPRPSGEDDFDAVVGLFGMLNVVLGLRPPGDPPDDPARQVEGWILGQAPPETY